MLENSGGGSMPIITGEESEREVVVEASKLMLISCRTAPKTAGKDDVLTALLTGKDKESLADDMDKVADERKIEGFKRDAGNVRNSAAVLLVGVRGVKSIGLNCGSCGYTKCEEFNEAEKKFGRDFTGPLCSFKLLDLGIALGSAAKTAGILNVDSRIMYRVGVSAMRMKFLSDADIVMGIP